MKAMKTEKNEEEKKKSQTSSCLLALKVAQAVNVYAARLWGWGGVVFGGYLGERGVCVCVCPDYVHGFLFFFRVRKKMNLGKGK